MTGLKKEAWTWRDVVEELGLEAAAGVALPAALGLIGITAAPITIGSLLLGGAISVAFFAFTKKADNNLTDLIERLESLDPNDQAKSAVEGWIKKLNEFKGRVAIHMLPSDPKDRAALVASRILAFRELNDYLSEMLKWWPEAKRNMDDWFGWDVGKAEHAIKETAAAISKQLTELKYRSQAEGAKVVKNVEKKVKETIKNQKARQAPGKAEVKKDKSNDIVFALQMVMSEISNAINAGAGSQYRKNGIYDKNTANALIGIMSSNPRLEDIITQNAKVNYKTLKDIEYMRKRPDLIRLLYSVLKSEAVQEIVEQIKSKHIPLSRRDLPERRRLSPRQ